MVVLPLEMAKLLPDPDVYEKQAYLLIDKGLELIQVINQQGIAIFMVEQNAYLGGSADEWTI